MFHRDAFEAAQVEDGIISLLVHDPDDRCGLRLVLTPFCLRARFDSGRVPAPAHLGAHHEEATSLLVQIELVAHSTLAEANALHLSLHTKARAEALSKRESWRHVRFCMCDLRPAESIGSAKLQRRGDVLQSAQGLLQKFHCVRREVRAAWGGQSGVARLRERG